MQAYILTAKDYNAKDRVLSSINNFDITNFIDIKSTRSLRFTSTKETCKLIKSEMKKDIVWIENFTESTVNCSEYMQEKGSFNIQPAKIENLPDGSNVDVVIVDGGDVLLNNLIFSDRLKYVNWHTHTDASVFNGAYNTQQSYSLSDSSYRHGTQVASVVAGNDIGWAKKCNIYSLNINATYNNGVFLAPQIIKNWHLAKSVNSDTGYKNPTVVNMSFDIGTPTSVTVGQGYDPSGIELSSTGMSGVVYRGTTYELNSGISDLATFLHSKEINFKTTTHGDTTSSNDTLQTLSFIRDTAPNAQKTLFEEMADTSGVFCTVAAGNSRSKVVPSGHTDYNNKIITKAGLEVFYNRLPTPANTSRAFVVGSVGSDKKRSVSVSSNVGPAVDIYAPGEEIVVFAGINGPQDREIDYLDAMTGTSYAAPQVAGMITCYLSDSNHNLSYSDVSGWLTENAQPRLNPSYATQDADDANVSLRTDSADFNKVAHYPGLKVSYPSKPSMLFNPSHSDIIVNVGEKHDVLATDVRNRSIRSFMVNATQSAEVVSSSGRFFLGSVESTAQGGIISSYPSGLGLGNTHYLIFDRDVNSDSVFDTIESRFQLDYHNDTSTPLPEPSSVMGHYIRYTDQNNHIASRVVASGNDVRFELVSVSGGAETSLYTNTITRTESTNLTPQRVAGNLRHYSNGSTVYAKHSYYYVNFLGLLDSTAISDSNWQVVSSAPANGKPGIFTESHDESEHVPMINIFKDIQIHEHNL